MKFQTMYSYKLLDSVSGTYIVDPETGEKVYGRRYTYSVEYYDKGKRRLIIDGSEDVYNYIQSFKDDTDIYKILKRLNGDLTKLDSNKGFYADVTKIPKDINDWYNKMEEADNIYNGLPTDLKQRFGNSRNEFVASIYNNDFEEKYTQYLYDTGRLKKPSSNDVVNKEVPKNE